MASTDTSKVTVIVPDAPAHLSDKAAKQWAATYTKALAQAKIDTPDNDSAQRTAALKAANALLAVPAPTSATDIDALDDWQFLLRETRTVKDVETRVCVTTDGRKYSFPVPPAKTAKADKTDK
jgi:broad specificity phosphatase PhoE